MELNIVPAEMKIKGYMTYLYSIYNSHSQLIKQEFRRHVYDEKIKHLFNLQVDDGFLNEFSSEKIDEENNRYVYSQIHIDKSTDNLEIYCKNLEENLFEIFMKYSIPSKDENLNFIREEVLKINRIFKNLKLSNIKCARTYTLLVYKLYENFNFEDVIDVYINEADLQNFDEDFYYYVALSYLKTAQWGESIKIQDIISELNEEKAQTIRVL